jgi:hypothetical protein
VNEEIKQEKLEPLSYIFGFLINLGSFFTSSWWLTKAYMNHESAFRILMLISFVAASASWMAISINALKVRDLQKSEKLVKNLDSCEGNFVKNFILIILIFAGIIAYLILIFATSAIRGDMEYSWNNLSSEVIRNIGFSIVGIGFIVSSVAEATKIERPFLSRGLRGVVFLAILLGILMEMVATQKI